MTSEVLPELRKASGLAGYEVFLTLDREHQKEMMQKLRDGLRQPVKVDYIKANTIANKAVSNKYGHPKMVKKENMTHEMLQERERVLGDVVTLMEVKEKYGLDISVSKTVYKAN